MSRFRQALTRHGPTHVAPGSSPTPWRHRSEMSPPLRRIRPRLKQVATQAAFPKPSRKRRRGETGEESKGQPNFRLPDPAGKCVGTFGVIHASSKTISILVTVAPGFRLATVDWSFRSGLFCFQCQAEAWHNCRRAEAAALRVLTPCRSISHTTIMCQLIFRKSAPIHGPDQQVRTSRRSLFYDCRERSARHKRLGHPTYSPTRTQSRLSASTSIVTCTPLGHLSVPSTARSGFVMELTLAARSIN